MSSAAPLAAALVLAAAVVGGCRSDAPAEPSTRRDPPGPLGRFVDLPLPADLPAFERRQVGAGGILWTTRDLDGDGRLDVVRTGEDDPALGPSPWVFYRNTGTGFAAGAEWPVPEGGYPLLQVPGHRTAGVGFLTAEANPVPGLPEPGGAWRTVDLDGDRRPDLVITGLGPGDDARIPGFPDAPHWRVHRNLGDGFAAHAEAWPVDAAAANVTLGVVDAGPAVFEGSQARGQLFDLDGDGLPDLVATTDREGSLDPEQLQVPGFADGEPHWRFCRNTGTGFAPAVAWPVPDANRGNTRNGLYAPAGEDVHSGGVAWTLADLDGDRRPDLVITSAPGRVEVPGLADGDPHWLVHRNTGSGFAPEPRRVSVPPFVSAEGRVPGPTGPYSLGRRTAAYWALLDFDGDGPADLLHTAEPTDGGAVVPGFPDAPAWRLYRGGAGGFDLRGAEVGVPDGGRDTAGFAGARQESVRDDETVAVHSWRTVDVDGDGRADLLWSLARHGEAGDTVLGAPVSPRWLVSYQH